MFRAEGLKRRAGATTCGLALLAIAVGASSPASARTPHDPCPGNNSSNHGRLVCQHRDSIGAGRISLLYAKETCDRDRKMVNTPVPTDALSTNYNATTADWDFWADRGEWVTWDGFGSFERGGHGGVAIGFTPVLHNWWIGGSWGARVFHNCDHVFPRRTSSEESSADPGPAGDIDLAGAGDDIEHGAAGVDEILGQRGSDELHGGPGDDQLLGGPGEDVAHGGPGSDELFDDQGSDYVDGGPGNDRFSTTDSDVDEIACGAGEDVVVADSTDMILHGCEHIFTSADEAPTKPPRN